MAASTEGDDDPEDSLGRLVIDEENTGGGAAGRTVGWSHDWYGRRGSGSEDERHRECEFSGHFNCGRSEFAEDSDYQGGVEEGGSGVDGGGGGPENVTMEAEDNDVGGVIHLGVGVEVSSALSRFSRARVAVIRTANVFPTS